MQIYGSEDMSSNRSDASRTSAERQVADAISADLGVDPRAVRGAVALLRSGRANLIGAAVQVGTLTLEQALACIRRGRRP